MLWNSSRVQNHIKIPEKQLTREIYDVEMDSAIIWACYVTLSSRLNDQNDPIAMKKKPYRIS